MTIADDRRSWRKSHEIEREVSAFWSACTHARVAARLMGEEPTRETVLRIMKSNACKRIDIENAELYFDRKATEEQ